MYRNKCSHSHRCQCHSRKYRPYRSVSPCLYLLCPLPEQLWAAIPLSDHQVTRKIIFSLLSFQSSSSRSSYRSPAGNELAEYLFRLLSEFLCGNIVLLFILFFALFFYFCCSLLLLFFTSVILYFCGTFSSHPAKIMPGFVIRSLFKARISDTVQPFFLAIAQRLSPRFTI